MRKHIESYSFVLLIILALVVVCGNAQTSDRPLYYEREITRADLAGRTLRELSLMRNTIYARAHNPFRKKWLNDYFSAQPWYRPEKRMDESKLSELDRKNAAIIVEYEVSLPRAELAEHEKALQAKKKADGKLSTEDAIELSLLNQTLGESVEEAENNEEATPSLDPRILNSQLTLEQLSDYSRRDLRLLRNTVYARRGRVFKSKILQDYFKRKGWYKPDPKYTDTRLTDLDNRNIKIIMSLEEELGGPLTESEDKNWFVAA